LWYNVPKKWKGLAVTSPQTKPKTAICFFVYKEYHTTRFLARGKSAGKLSKNFCWEGFFYYG